MTECNQDPGPGKDSREDRAEATEDVRCGLWRVTHTGVTFPGLDDGAEVTTKCVLSCLVMRREGDLSLLCPRSQ